MLGTTRRATPSPYNETVQTCRAGQGPAAAAGSRCVCLTDDLDASAGVLALIPQLRFEHPPAGIQHRLRLALKAPCLERYPPAEAAWIAADSPPKAAPTGRPTVQCVLANSALDGIRADVFEMLGSTGWQTAQVETAQPSRRPKIGFRGLGAGLVGPIPDEVHFPSRAIKPRVDFRLDLQLQCQQDRVRVRRGRLFWRCVSVPSGHNLAP
jgi:hypothetical protein